MPFEIGKAILKEVNQNNDQTTLQDLQGQNLKNSMLLIEEKISNIERVKKSRSFSGGISDDDEMENDLIYVFVCGDLT